MYVAAIDVGTAVTESRGDATSGKGAVLGEVADVTAALGLE